MTSKPLSCYHCIRLMLGQVDYEEDIADWLIHHCRTWIGSNDARPLRHLITGLAVYADQHKRRYDSNIAEDNILGAAWLDMWQGVRTLLNGELWGLDGGTLDALLLQIAEVAGYDVSEM